MRTRSPNSLAGRAGDDLDAGVEDVDLLFLDRQKRLTVGADLGADSIKAGATACIVGDTEAYALAKRNPDWAVVLDPSNSFDKRPNTWMIRYGDVAWKNFLDTWCAYVAANGQVQRLYDKYAAEIL